MVDAGSGSIGWAPASYLAPVDIGNKQEAKENKNLVGPEEGRIWSGNLHVYMVINSY